MNASSFRGEAVNAGIDVIAANNTQSRIDNMERMSR